MQDARERWDRLHRERGLVLDASLLMNEVAPWVPSGGRALDVAGGCGRHAVWLARRGLRVLLTDSSPVAIELARRRARAAGVRVDTEVCDHEALELPTGPFELVFQFHFLERGLFPLFPSLLALGGRLIVVHPTRRNLERHERPSARFLLEEGELATLASGLRIELLTEAWSVEDRHEAVLVARRTS